MTARPGEQTLSRTTASTPDRADGIRHETPARPGAPTATREVETTMVDADALIAVDESMTDADRRFFGLRASGFTGPIDHNGHPVVADHEREHLLGPDTGQDVRELEIANAELRHVVTQLVACQEENKALRAELAAANDGVLELLQELEIARAGHDDTARGDQ